MQTQAPAPRKAAVPGLTFPSAPKGSRPSVKRFDAYSDVSMLDVDHIDLSGLAAQVTTPQPAKRPRAEPIIHIDNELVDVYDSEFQLMTFPKKLVCIVLGKESEECRRRMAALRSHGVEIFYHICTSEAKVKKSVQMALCQGLTYYITGAPGLRARLGGSVIPARVI